VGPRSGTLSTTTTIIDLGGNFVVRGVKPGHTVFATDVTFAGQRRQVVTVNSAVQITVEAFTGTGAITYQIVDSLATFGRAGSLQADWDLELENELQSLEGDKFVDASTRYVAESALQATTISGIAMGASDALLVFVALDNNGAGVLTLSSATFNGQPLTLQQSTSGSNFALFVYYATGVSGVTGSLVITATDTSVSQKIYALKLSSLKTITSGVGVQTTAPSTLTSSTTLKSREAGDLILSFGASRVAGNELYPVEDHNTLIPLFQNSGVSSILRATRATAANQTVTSSIRVNGTSDTSLIATVVISKDVAIDGTSEKAGLEGFFNATVPDRGLGDLSGNITNSTTITGNFTNVAPGDVLYIRHGANNGVYTIATATLSSATVVESFPSPPEAVTFRAGDLNIPGIAVLQAVFPVLKSVDAAIVSAGNLELQQHCPILVYRNGTPAGSLPGTTDSPFTIVSGVLTLAGARGRPISSLATREAFLTARAAISDLTTLENTLAQQKLYDGRYVWIDGRINLETGILPKKTRAVENRQKALEKILANLTKLLTV
jgi:hypothetical protein